MLKLKIVIVRCHDKQGDIKVIIIIIIKKHENQRENPFSNRKYPLQIILQKLQRPPLCVFVEVFSVNKMSLFYNNFLCFLLQILDCGQQNRRNRRNLFEPADRRVVHVGLHPGLRRPKRLLLPSQSSGQLFVRHFKSADSR
jgi:hypothetical protein